MSELWRKYIMKVEVYRDPIFHLVLKDFFPDKINKQIMNEAIVNKKKFNDGIIGKGLDKNFRSNKTAYYDIIYITDRSKSFLLSALDGKFSNNAEFRELLSTCPLPVGDFLMTTTHETQVSRYGDEKQYYNWHQDRFANMKRHLTLVYYFFKEPKKWTGGEIVFTDSPAFEAKLFEENPKIKTLIPENNMAVVFGANMLHRVEPTNSPKDFASGRFSVNCWIGFA